MDHLQSEAVVFEKGPPSGGSGQGGGTTAGAPPFHIASLLSRTPQREDAASYVYPSTPGLSHPQPPVACWTGEAGNVGNDTSPQELPLLQYCTGCNLCTQTAIQGPDGVLPPPRPTVPPLYSPPFLYSPPSVLHLHYQLSPPPPPPPPLTNSSLQPPSSQPQGKLRTMFSQAQLQTLEEIFSEKKYVSSADRRGISQQVGITEKQVKMWFQNRRTKMRKERSLVSTPKEID